MGCSAANNSVIPVETANIEHSLVHLAVTNQTDALIRLVDRYEFEVNLNAPLNFRGDTLLHYACAKNNVALVKYLLDKKEILLTVKNKLKQKPMDMTKNEDIRRLCS